MALDTNCIAYIIQDNMKYAILLTVLAAIGAIPPFHSSGSAMQNRAEQARRNVATKLMPYLGQPVFIRIIKEDWQLELWWQHRGKWEILKTYPIAGMSGQLGPKECEGDCQAPEGFYRVQPHALNPKSKYYLSFNIGYPNEYDKKRGRTGSHIMVHGSNVSIGCFAMTDKGIEEIYTLVAEALQAGQSYVPVQVYPFRMTPQRMEEEHGSPHYEFWQHLLDGWRYTEEKREPWPDSDN